ncbi:Na/Pi symporter [Pseudochryseolinea flava]|uniref:Na/Pi cotransporter family protein n=1 Tax=Pseudochryseolinea flava TaxID=2059302 RepID=A0A364Y8V8_9BACT|nr:Na/Pi symporter [Pseudochryseolinea flava]RAW03380.1 Na/Pi cotransporter family protein [Pseudochryseolinea flava]
METSNIAKPSSVQSNLKIALYIFSALVLFLFSLEVMVSSLSHLGKDLTDTILLATTNPFVGLFIGLLLTAILQSSSTITALVIALVASAALTVEAAIPIIIGANIGTTITAMIVSLGFIPKKKEFKRATAAGAYHVFFNLLTTVILFPLEYSYGFFSKLSSQVSAYFMKAPFFVRGTSTKSLTFLDHFVDFLLTILPNPFVISGLALILLFASILLFRKLISDLVKAKSPETFARFFFLNPWKSFGWGLVTTAAIRSSTITTSVVVPIVAKKLAKLRQAVPFIMGANVGTTVTAIIAAFLYGTTPSAVSIAMAHFLFNLLGVIVFMFLPGIKGIPIQLAEALGRLSMRYRFAGVLFLLLIFFIIPFSLIYLDRM